jgi:nitroimidazol reductase NimA-like FMN-containing flavoprotein (pyridoxamine 5'-phosphate oxidase superfamily)
VNADGWPYVVPLLHVFSGDVISVHNTAVRGHFRSNVERDPRACFEVDEPVEVFDYGRFECDSGLAYRSAIAYGRIRIVEERAAKIRFFDELLAKYGTGVPGRPKSFYPRLDEVTVYALAVERVHRQALPPFRRSPSSGRLSIAPKRPTRSHEMAFSSWAIVGHARSTVPRGSCPGGLPVGAAGRL